MCPYRVGSKRLSYDKDLKNISINEHRNILNIVLLTASLMLFAVEGDQGGGRPNVQVQQSEITVSAGQSARFICSAAGA